MPQPSRKKRSKWRTQPSLLPSTRSLTWMARQWQDASLVRLGFARRRRRRKHLEVVPECSTSRRQRSSPGSFQRFAVALQWRKLPNRQRRYFQSEYCRASASPESEPESPRSGCCRTDRLLWLTRRRVLWEQHTSETILALSVFK